MRCPKCGKKIRKSELQCDRCGYVPTADDYATARKRTKIKRWAIIGIACATMTTIIGLPYFGYLDAPIVRKTMVSAGVVPLPNKQESEEELEDNINEYIDTDEYYSENATILNKLEAATSETNLSETSVTELLNSRGFDTATYPVYTLYDLDGSYNETSVSDTDTVHPSYVMYYAPDENEIWTITVTNGQLTAYPVMYNLTGTTTGIETIVAETENLMTYDSAQNVFYECKPNPDVLTVKVIDEINVQSLGSIEW